MKGPSLRLCYIAHGGSPHTHKWLNYFVRRGHRVHLISLDGAVDKGLGSLDFEVEVHPLEIQGFHLRRLQESIRIVVTLRRILRLVDPDILHAHYIGPGAWYGMLTGFHPLVVTAMGNGDIQGTEIRFKNLRERILIPLTIYRADLVTSWTPPMVRMIRPWVRGAAEAHVINGGVDLTKFKRTMSAEDAKRRIGLTPDSKVVFSCRGLAPRFNVETLIRSIPFIVRQVPKVVFLVSRYVAGSYPDYERHVRNLVREMRLDQKVVFVDRMNNDRLVDFYNASDVTVSIPSSDYLGLATFESMACQTPCVVSDLPEYDEEIFRHRTNVLLVPPLDPARVADAIVACLEDTSLRETLITNGLQTVKERGDYHKEMVKMEGLYERLLTTRTGRSVRALSG